MVCGLILSFAVDCFGCVVLVWVCWLFGWVQWVWFGLLLVVCVLLGFVYCFVCLLCVFVCDCGV